MIYPPLTRQWPEELIQMYMATSLLRDDILFHGDPLGLIRNKIRGAKAKLCGARAGWPDLCFPTAGGKVLWVELKKKKGGVISEDQEKVHAEMRDLGHRVEVVWARHGPDALEQVISILGGPK